MEALLLANLTLADGASWWDAVAVPLAGRFGVLLVDGDGAVDLPQA